MKISCLKVCLLTTIVSVPAWTASIAIAQDCVVTTTADSALGLPDVPGSLRDCMNRITGGHAIVFDPLVFDLSNSDAATIINVLYQLPAMDDGSVTMEASDRRVTVNGSGAGSAYGLVIASNGNQIRGLTLRGFEAGGVRVDGALSNTIGGSRNTGTGPNGQGLRISQCGSFGIEIRGATSTANHVKGCWIGLDASGSSSAANLAGVIVQGGAHANTIGSVIAGEANVISGNTFEGITLADAGTDDNVIIGNVIGASATTDSIGTRSAVGNGSAGVFMSRGTQNSKVGGDTSSEGNYVAFNGGNGVEVRDPLTRRNSVRSNRIGRNSRGGIALFDGSNDSVRPPTIVSVQDLGPNAMGTATNLRMTGTAPQAGEMDFFNDSGAQGETFLTANDALGGAWTADVSVGEVVHNPSVTLTDLLGNTSQFSVLGLTDDDDDGDGVSDEIEGLAGTDPNVPSDTPQLSTQPLTISKVRIKLNFTSSGKDSIKAKVSLALPPGFTPDGSTVGVYIAGHSEQFTLDADGKASTANSKIGLKTTAKDGPTFQYSIKLATLLTSVASSGLSEKTTPDGDERWIIPVAVTTGDSVSFSTVTLTYKATQGKSGKAKIAK